VICAGGGGEFQAQRTVGWKYDSIPRRITMLNAGTNILPAKDNNEQYRNGGADWSTKWTFNIIWYRRNNNSLFRGQRESLERP